MYRAKGQEDRGVGCVLKHTQKTKTRGVGCVGCVVYMYGSLIQLVLMSLFHIRRSLYKCAKVQEDRGVACVVYMYGSLIQLVLFYICQSQNHIHICQRYTMQKDIYRVAKTHRIP